MQGAHVSARQDVNVHVVGDPSPFLLGREESTQGIDASLRSTLARAGESVDRQALAGIGPLHHHQRECDRSDVEEPPADVGERLANVALAGAGRELRQERGLERRVVVQRFAKQRLFRSETMKQGALADPCTARHFDRRGADPALEEDVACDVEQHLSGDRLRPTPTALRGSRVWSINY